MALETSKRTADQAVQIHGGYGFQEDYPVARYWRDVKVNEIGEGTSEVPASAYRATARVLAGLRDLAVREPGKPHPHRAWEAPMRPYVYAKCERFGVEHG